MFSEHDASKEPQAASTYHPHNTSSPLTTYDAPLDCLNPRPPGARGLIMSIWLCLIDCDSNGIDVDCPASFASGDGALVLFQRPAETVAKEPHGLSRIGVRKFTHRHESIQCLLRWLSESVQKDIAREQGI
jgi:hypothetical protein